MVKKCSWHLSQWHPPPPPTPPHPPPTPPTPPPTPPTPPTPQWSIYGSVNWVSIGSGNGWVPVQHQAITQTNTDLLHWTLRITISWSLNKCTTLLIHQRHGGNVWRKGGWVISEECLVSFVLPCKHTLPVFILVNWLWCRVYFKVE